MSSDDVSSGDETTPGGDASPAPEADEPVRPSDDGEGADTGSTAEPDASGNGGNDDTDDGDDVCTYHEGPLGFDPDDRERPVLVWDGDCGFCKRSLERIRDQVGDRVLYAPYQKIHPHVDGLGPEDFEQSVHLIEPDGSYCNAAEAIFRTLAYAPGHGHWLWMYEHVPGFASVTEWGYRWVAEHRPTASRWSRRLLGEDLRPSERRLSRWLFIRLLAVVFLVAFVSFAAQIPGLFGEHGITPAVEHLEQMRQFVQREHAGDALFGWFPTLFAWIEPTEAALFGTCMVGSTLAVLLLLGVWPRLLLFAEWALYLSLVQVGNVFFGYQWDMLLLEAGLTAVVLAPSGPFPRAGDRSPSGASVFLGRWLLFRLMFMSGVVKVLSNGTTWNDGTALTYHFWTQPLPTWTAYWVHHLPDVLLVAGTYGTLLLELAVPFFVFGPRRLERWGAVLLAGLQVAILATGNYCFFNVLTLSLCLLLIDDRVWRDWLPDSLLERLGAAERLGPVPTSSPSGERTLHLYARWGGRVGLGLLVAGVVGVTGVKMIDRFRGMSGSKELGEQLPEDVRYAMDRLSAFRSLNNYGLFADMTTDRPELIVQGSNDGETWKTYRFKWKPDEVDERPSFVQPHQPRLDWQMWFQALRQQRVHERSGRCGASRWFLNFQKRLLEGSESVETLLEGVPFEEPPRYVRAVMYRYAFTSPGADTEAWWTRERLGQYCPTVTLQEGRLAPVRGSTDGS